MESLKGLAETVQQLVYETLGLLLPGALAVLSIAAAIGPIELQAVLRLGSQYTALGVVGAYLAGYVVQGLSRPVNQLADDIFTAIPKVVLKMLGEGARKLVGRIGTHLTGRQSHVTETSDEHTAQLDPLIADYWANRLGLAHGKRLRADHIRDLCFSDILHSRGHLDRYRAATSLCRGAAFSVVVATVILVAQLALGDRPMTLGIVGLLAVLVVVFYALTERANMYHRLWEAVVPTQFLANASRNGSFEPPTAPASPPASVLSTPGATHTSTTLESTHA